MAKTNSFDIASVTDLNEVRNAVNQTMKEVRQRYDLKSTSSEVVLEEQSLILVSDDDFKLKALTEVLGQKLTKRGVSLKALSPGKVVDAAGGKVRQEILIQQGIPTEKAKEISKFIRDLKVKVQASIQGDVVRVSGRDRDTLQEVMQALRERDFGIHTQFTNYRSS